MVFAGLAAALLLVAWCLWVRRDTWTNRWELAGTLAVAFQGLALLLTWPYTSKVLSTPLHALTGMWNLEDFCGHCCYVAAAACVVYHPMSRMEGDIGPRLRNWVWYPMILTFILRMVFFKLGNGSHKYSRDVFQIDPDPWFATYWVLLCGFVIYLLGLAGYLFSILWKDPYHRPTATIYMFGITVGVVVCAGKIATAASPLHAAPLPVWMGCCVGVGGFAFGFGSSWWRRKRNLGRRGVPVDVEM